MCAVKQCRSISRRKMSKCAGGCIVRVFNLFGRGFLGRIGDVCTLYHMRGIVGSLFNYFAVDGE